VIVSIGPTALSGRLRHAIRPHAAKETPDRLWSTSSTGTGAPPSVSAGIWAMKPAAAVELHSTSQNHGLCVGTFNRPSTWSRARAGGLATSSLAPTVQGSKRIIRRSRL
jgi:hypothetical protein